MKSVLLSTAVVAFGLSMSACSHINMGNASLASKLGMKDEAVYCDPYAGVNDPCYEDRGYAYVEAEYDYWDTEEAKRSQTTDFCAMNREQLIAFSKEYELYGGDLSGMSPEQHADFMLALC